MKKPKLDILIATFCYAGNGGVATVLPDIATWLVQNTAKMRDDDRIDRVAIKRYGDIPLTAERNRVVKDAKDGGFDVIIMLDSDNVPDLYLGKDSKSKPFFSTSFDLLYDRMMRGLPTVVCAPYCGPPPHPVNGGEENVYVFYLDNNETMENGELGSIKVSAYTREHASIMGGIQPCAAGPTGCIMYSTSAFDLMPIDGMSTEEILHRVQRGELDVARASQLLSMDSWFFYEFTDRYCTNKASTEDVANTREIAFAGAEKFGEDVVFCNWDAWAGHMKPKCVGAPRTVKIEQVSGLFAEAVRNNVSGLETTQHVDFGGDLPPVEESKSLDDLEDNIPDEEGDLNSKVMVMGKPFRGSSWDSVICERIMGILKTKESQKVAVYGDWSGELCYAAQSAGVRDVFNFIGNPEGFDAFGSIEKPVKFITSKFMEVSNEIGSEKVDAIIVDGHADGAVTFAHMYFNRHLNVGGIMAVLDMNEVEWHLENSKTYEMDDCPLAFIVKTEDAS